MNFFNLKQRKRARLSIGLILCWLPLAVSAAALEGTIARVKPSIVGVGSYSPVRQPRAQLVGTGFVLGNGLLVATNYHNISRPLESGQRESWVVFVGTGNQPEVRSADIVARDPVHDLALLKIGGSPLPALVLADNDNVREGLEVAFTGYPIGSVLGLYPVSHRGIVSSITPIAVPQVSTGQLNAKAIRRLRDPYMVFQLDATAYPGNSGSPLYHQDTGGVIGVINKVFVKESKESALENPSGITFAIPSRYLLPLLRQVGTIR